jgi:hypothetical protein
MWLTRWPPARRISLATTGTEIVARVTRLVSVRPPRGQRAAAGRGDDVADADPRALRRRVVVDGLHAQPPRDAAHREPHAGEAAVRRVLEVRVLLRREVRREAVVELRDGAGDRRVGERGVADLAVVLAVDLVQRLGDGARALVAEQRVGHRVGQPARVPAQPDAQHEQGRAEQDEGEDQRAAAHRGLTR